MLRNINYYTVLLTDTGTFISKDTFLSSVCKLTPCQLHNALSGCMSPRALVSAVSSRRGLVSVLAMQDRSSARQLAAPLHRDRSAEQQAAQHSPLFQSAVSRGPLVLVSVYCS